MEYFADLHIHSPFSRATSKAGHLQGLAAWAVIKGIDVVGTGDFTHPVWFSQIASQLREVEPGFFQLREQAGQDILSLLPPGISQVDTSAVRFVLTAEVSSIYKRAGKVRKVHNILFAPDLASAARINATLAGIGNLEADGRPILGLDCENLLEIVLEKAPEGFLVPAHVWTPWFSLFGSKSGFDTLEECFGSLSGHIFALETGLSSDPAMNRCLSSLDRLTLISNSDCHSPGKLGREANLFSTGFDFHSMKEAIASPYDGEGRQRFAATVEFFPEEGKYHCDGHRKCGVCLQPEQSDAHDSLCPVCGKPLTIGVLNRVMSLADRREPVYPPGSPAAYSLIPLPEILSELYEVGAQSKKVQEQYGRLVREFGSELHILLQAPLDAITSQSSGLLAEAIRRMRQGEVIRHPGYDGEFGVIRVFNDQEKQELGGQLGFFARPLSKKNKPSARVLKIRKPTTEDQPVRCESVPEVNKAQLAAIDDSSRHILVIAGPGTGKTYTLVERVIRVLHQESGPCTVITFTNRAADAVRRRISVLAPQDLHRCVIATFHGYCLHWLLQAHPGIRPAGPEARRRILKTTLDKHAGLALTKKEQELAHFLHTFIGSQCVCPTTLHQYFRQLDRERLVDLDAVIPLTLALVNGDSVLAETMRLQTGSLFIDEFQDINPSQYALVDALARTSSVFAIGDPDQSIYAFRDASPRLFFQFAVEHQPSIHHLTRNYRNPARVVEAAGQVIGHNQSELARPVLEAAARGPGVLTLRRYNSAEEEARAVAITMERLLGGTSHRAMDGLRLDGRETLVGLSDCAVLYRTGNQAGLFAESFARQGIPVQVVDLDPYYQKAPLRPLYLFVLLAAGRGDLDQLLELFACEQGISPEQLDLIGARLLKHPNEPLTALRDMADQFPEESRAIILHLIQRITFFQQSCGHGGVSQALAELSEYYEVVSTEPDWKRFVAMGLAFSHDLSHFALHLLGNRDQVVYDERAEAVTLMTLHAAKGLEFPVVFLVGAEEGLLPLAERASMTEEEKRDHEAEERRLFFVGMTRASGQLHLSWAGTRNVHGVVRNREASRFLREFDQSLLDETPAREAKKNSGRQLRLFRTP